MSYSATNDPQTGPEKKEVINRSLDGYEILSVRKNIIDRAVDRLQTIGRTVGVIDTPKPEIVETPQPARVENVALVETLRVESVSLNIEKSDDEKRILAEIESIYEEAA